MTRETFDAAYDGTIYGMQALRSSPLYDVIADAICTTPDGALGSLEIPDQWVTDFGVALSTRDETQGKPQQRREFPVLKAMLQRLLEYLVTNLISGGFGGLFPTS